MNRVESVRSLHRELPGTGVLTLANEGATAEALEVSKGTLQISKCNVEWRVTLSLNCELNS